MKTFKPYYYDDFKCIASNCSDSCCIGWEIDIDSESLKLYQNEKGELGEKLSKNIAEGAFVLTEEERCPFLRGDNLCELICKKGEGYLCEICREHPRYYEWYGDHTDMGLGLCCEEACRLLFQNDMPLFFVSEGDAEADEAIDLLLNQRDNIIRILQDRTLPLEARFKKLTAIPSFDEIKELWQELEPFDYRWTDTIKVLDPNSIDLQGFAEHIGNRVYEYEHLAVYLMHRYFMKSLCTYDADSILYGIAVYLYTQFLWDAYTYTLKGKFDFDDRIDTAKYLSKQLEYSEENTDVLMTRGPK